MWETREKQIRIFSEGLKERVHFEELDVDRRIILKWIFKR
jgi:hypothetical protein